MCGILLLQSICHLFLLDYEFELSQSLWYLVLQSIGVATLLASPGERTVVEILLTFVHACASVEIHAKNPF